MLKRTAGIARTVFALPLLAAAIAQAQTAPDAGTLLREQPKPPAVPQAPLKPPVVQTPQAEPADAGPRVRVSAIRVKGNTLISEAELVEQVRFLVGGDHSARELRNGALVLVGYYSQKGYLARVFLPQQDIKDGVVEYQVIEGVRGDLRIETKGGRLDANLTGRFIDSRLGSGAIMDLSVLTEALTILNEQPGVEAKSSLAPGKQEREVDVLVTAEPKPLFSGNVGVNNQGARGTGVLQATAGGTLSNPTGRFDALSLLANEAQGSNFVRADYGIAVGDRGLRIGANLSALRYRLVQADFAALNASGDAQTAGLVASYPLVRSTGLNLSVNGSYDWKQLTDRTVAGETSNRRVQVGTLGVSGYRLVGGSLGGVFTFGAGVSAGNADQRNAAALTADQAGRQTQGSFTKASWNGGLLHPVNTQWAVNAIVRGQFAGKNLDSSERFSLGGPYGVRGYPVSEAVGDDGWIGSVALQRSVGEALTLSGFYDAGVIRINHNQPAAGAVARNSYSLASAGLSAVWRLESRVSLNATLAMPVGGNPGAQANGTNVDGSRRATRAWVGLSALF